MKILQTCLVTLALAFPASAWAQKEKDVRVINTPAEAVPVSVNGAVSVGNTAANPVLVRDVDRAGSNLYQSSVTVPLTFNSTGTSALFAPIPANTVLIIEHVSIFGSVPPGQRIHVTLTVGTIGGTAFRHWFTPETLFSAGGSGSIDFQILSQQTSIASTIQPIAQVGRTSLAGGDAQVEINISGRLVPASP